MPKVREKHEQLADEAPPKVREEWGTCPGCGHARRIERGSLPPVMVVHRAWNPAVGAVGEMWQCWGSGQPPAGGDDVMHSRFRSSY